MDLIDVVLKDVKECKNIPDEHQFVFEDIKMQSQYRGVMSFNVASPKGFYTLTIEFDIGKGILNINKKVV